MKKILFVFATAIVLLLLQNIPAYARSCTKEYNANFANGEPPSEIEFSTNNQLIIPLSGLQPGRYTVKVVNTQQPNIILLQKPAGDVGENGNLTINLTEETVFLPDDDSTRFKILLSKDNGTYCDLHKYRVSSNFDCTMNVTYEYNNDDNNPPTGTYQNPSCYELNSGSMTFSISNASMNGQPLTGRIKIGHNLTGLKAVTYAWIDINNGSGSSTANNNSIAGKDWIEDSSQFIAYYDTTDVVMCTSGSRSFKDFCTLDELEEDVPPTSGDTAPKPFEICESVPECKSNNNCDCIKCFNENGIWTALGCIRFNPKDFIVDFLKIALGIAGGIALLLMIYGSFLISTSAGDPKKAEEGKEMITGTIAGLLFIIFSVFLLRLIGVEIFAIPGF